MSLNVQKIRITNTAASKLFLVGAALLTLFYIKDVLVEVGAMLFVALILAAALHEPVSWLQKKRVPRVLACLFCYALLFFIISLIIYLIFPPLIKEMISLANSFPQYIEKVGGGIDYWIERYALQEQAREILLEFSRRLEGYASGILATLFSLFGGLISTLAIIVVSFYLTLNASEVKRFLVSLMPNKNQQYISGLISRLQVKMGQWLRSQLILMAIIGLVVYIGLTILNVRYALMLALIAGLLEIVPWLGPWLAGVLAVFLSFFQSPFLALLVVILYVAVQQLENNLIVPQIMKRVVGLNPVVVILALLIGGKIAGILGAVLAVPSAAILAEFVRDYRQYINK